MHICLSEAGLFHGHDDRLFTNFTTNNIFQDFFLVLK